MGRVNVPPGRVGSGPRKVTRGQLWIERKLQRRSRRGAKAERSKLKTEPGTSNIGRELLSGAVFIACERNKPIHVEGEDSNLRRKIDPKMNADPFIIHCPL